MIYIYIYTYNKVMWILRDVCPITVVHKNCMLPTMCVHVCIHARPQH